MAILKRRKKSVSKREEAEIINEEVETQKMLVDDGSANRKETKDKEIKTAGEKNNKSKSIKKGVKIIANGRCFGASSLECPLKTVRNHETKILDIDVNNNSVLIDEGWISKEFIK